MKIVIEIGDSALRAAVDAQVGQALASMSVESIKMQLHDVIEKQIERLNIGAILSDRVDTLINRRLDIEVENALGNNTSLRKTAIRELATAFAEKALKSAMTGK